jgi:hypothetical protein
MSRRFMIVKPRPCCGYDEYVGYISTAKMILYADNNCCGNCGIELDPCMSIEDSKDGFYIELDRIIWLDDPDSSHDTIQEIEDKLKV